MAKVYWAGKHVGPGFPINSPLGKLHKEGLDLLHRHGWVKVEAGTQLVPVFAWTTRKGANFPARGTGLPQIRQLPQQCSAVLDDKRSMWECLAAAGRADLTPPTWVDVDAFLERSRASSGPRKEHQFLPPPPPLPPQQQLHEQAPSGAAPGPASGCSAGETVGTAAAAPSAVQLTATGAAAAAGAAAVLLDAAAAAPQPREVHQPSGPGPPPLTSAQPQAWFLKHRRGVKGQAVYWYGSLAELHDRLSALSARSRRDFVVQAGIPPLLAHGRKFVLRAHVLLLAPALPRPLQAYVHREVIVMEHARPYSPTAADRAAHISSCGSGHPRPYSLWELEGSLPAVEGSLSKAAAGAESPLAANAAAAPAATGQPEGTAVTPPPSATPLQRSIWEQVCTAAAASIRAGAAAGLLPRDPDPEAVFCHVFGHDLLVDSSGRVWLLEVNAYPAIASGTMAGVDRDMFTRLVGDVLQLAVLAATDGAAAQPGGFVPLLA